MWFLFSFLFISNTQDEFMKFSDCVQQIWVMQNSPEAIGWMLKEDWLGPIRCIWLKYHLIFISRLIILDFTLISINVVDANYVANQLLLAMQRSADIDTDAEDIHTWQHWRCVLGSWLFPVQFQQQITIKFMLSGYKGHCARVGLRVGSGQFLGRG